MNKLKKIIFRAEGNSTIGLGHLYRLFAIVEMVKEEFEYIYLTRSPKIYNLALKSNNLDIIPEGISFEDEPKWLAKKYEPEEYIIIADGYQFVSEYQLEVKKLGFSLVYIDDLAQEHMYADLVVNHSPSLKFSNFKAEYYSKIVLGTKYAMLRPSFIEAAKKSRQINHIDTAFICFGGADELNLSLKAARALMGIPQIKKIHIVLGAAYNNRDIFELAENHPKKLKTHRNLSENALINLMKSCNFAIAPSSTISYELCCVKLPILSGYVVDNQKAIYRGLKDKNAIYGGNDFSSYEIEDFKLESIKIINEKLENHRTKIKCQAEIFDGMQKNRFIFILKDI